MDENVMTEFRNDVTYAEKLELVKRLLAESCDVDESLGVVTEYMERDAIHLKVLLETLLLDGEERVRVVRQTLDEFIQEYDTHWCKYEDRASNWYFMHVSDMYVTTLNALRARVKAAASLSYKLSALLEAMPALGEGLKNLATAKAIANEMTEAAILMQDKRNKQPASKVGSLYNFAKKN